MATQDKKPPLFSDEEILSAGAHHGLDIQKLPVRQQHILTVMYKYDQGWITEDQLEFLMIKASRNG